MKQSCSNQLASAKSVALISNTVNSPSLSSSIEALKSSTSGTFDHIQYDPISYSAIRRANELNFGKSFIPTYDFSKAKITIFAAGSEIAKKWASQASKKTIVIDNSKYFRMDKDVPLIVPEVNPNDLRNHKNIIANPNCSTMQMLPSSNTRLRLSPNPSSSIQNGANFTEID